MSRVFAVGDIHGCLEEFDELLKLCEFKKGTDRLVLVGDLMDRGPDPVGVVRRARELEATCLLGNHEEKHLRWRKHEKKVAATPGYKNPMRRMRSPDADAHEKLSDDDFTWLAALPLTINLGQIGSQVGDWIVVHAGFEPCLPLAEQRPDKLLRVRYVNADGKMVPINNDTDQPEGTVRWASVWKGEHHVVYGHHATSLKKPQMDVYLDETGRQWWRYGIDTGCCFGGRLTAIDLATCDYVQVAAKHRYAEVWGAKETDA